MELLVEIKLLPNGKHPEKHPTGDWWDVFSSIEVSYTKGSCLYIPLGFACKMPEGYEAHLCARSSLFAKTGLIQTNGVGVIDNAYCGDNDEWMLPVVALCDGAIKQHQKIAQFRLMTVQPKLTFIPVEKLNTVDRHGFGSTGD